MFDIAKLDTFTRAEEGVAMEVVNPRTNKAVLDEEGRPVTITLLGRNSTTARQTYTRIRDRQMERANKGIIANDAEKDRDDVEYLSACTLGWSMTSMDDQPFGFSPENAKRLWGDPRMRTVREQAMAFVQNDGNFLRD
jgi:hypothetical protein